MNSNIHYLTMAGEHARKVSRCKKVSVGSVIVDTHQRVVLGANRAMPDECDLVSCNQISLIDNKPHCVATIHSEVDAIIKAARNLYGATIYVTRYPCENCARAIVAAGISKVVYGRFQEISAEARHIFDWGKVEVIHEVDYAEFDVYE